MKSFLAIIIIFLPLLKPVISTACNQDNCLRALTNKPTSAADFCGPYLAATSTTITSLPTFLAKCDSSTSRISSACSCFVNSEKIISTSATAPAGAAATITNTITATETDTVSASASATTTTITLPATTITSSATATVTVTATAVAPSVAIDENGCPAIDGTNDGGGYIYECNVSYGSGGIVIGTNPGWNVQDCASQCFFNILGGDCLGATYTPPSSLYSNFGNLLQGTCTLYEFPDGRVVANGVAAATFEGF